MAYLQSLVRECGECITRPATERLLTNRNEPFGDYCGRCAPTMLARLTADENRQLDARRAQRAADLRTRVPLNEIPRPCLACGSQTPGHQCQIRPGNRP